MRTASKLTADVPSDDNNTGIGRVGIEMLAAASLSRAEAPPVKINDQSVKGCKGAAVSPLLSRTAQPGCEVSHASRTAAKWITFASGR